MSSDQIYWILELDVKAGKEEDFKKLREEMVESTRMNEPDCLAYEWSLSEGHRTCHIYERYRDNDALMVHLQNFGAHFAERFMDCLSPLRFTIYGNPGADAREALKGFGPVYMHHEAGFIR